MRRGKKIVVHGDGTSLWTMTHNSDLGRAFVGLLGNPAAVGHTFHITSDEVLTWDQITLAIGKAAGAQPDIVHVGSDFISAFDPEARGNLIGDKAQCAVFDNSKIKRFVPEFRCTVSLAEGLRRTIAWLDAHPEEQRLDSNATVEKILAAWNSLH